jgi:hypothetical protein
MPTWRTQRVNELNHMLVECFFYHDKTKERREYYLTEACVLAGMDPRHQCDRDILSNKLHACRTWETSTELTNIQSLAEALVPHTRWSRFVSHVKNWAQLTKRWFVA